MIYRDFNGGGGGHRGGNFSPCYLEFSQSDRRYQENHIGMGVNGPTLAMVTDGIFKHENRHIWGVGVDPKFQNVPKQPVWRGQ